ncbi:MAG: hypothetical protein KGD59_11460 [Candidatus Heimdallarchaeota archaeon]|nr:hypothetical protein [Candidatus Heimdallarchaeota archaeon]MBY8995160.1 hypothetical protein [Candidatus Heimdallarchaeota archaeon]
MSYSTPHQSDSKWLFAGYWDALIGGFILIIQGFLSFFSQLNEGLGVFGSLSFFALVDLWWLSALLSMVIGFLVLLLIWKWIIDKIGRGPLISDPIGIGIVLLILGLIAGGIGGVLVLIGGIFYLIGSSK